MTNQQINIAIAEHCGFNLEEYRMEEGGINVAAIPDYCNDLNAMHKAENLIDKDDLHFVYSYNLYNTVVPMDHQPFRATARQRAESFLKTIGKWEGS